MRKDTELNLSKPAARELSQRSDLKGMVQLIGHLTILGLGALAIFQSESFWINLVAMMAYGMHLGTAFQLIDDVLDYSATSEEIGKNIGDDLAEGKPTLPLILVVRQTI